MALDAHVVSHTHWDREWYHPVERFRQLLVALVDELLDDPPAAGESFLLDGQAIVVDDYLAVRRERADALGALLREGRLEAGPWYVLADELIPGGEALVRNLFAGRGVLRRFGATAPRALYCPDSFGHPAALPAIAAGFGFPVIVLWRGYGGARWPRGDTARWSAPNGDTVLLFHLPRDGYEFGSHLPATANDAAARWHRMREELLPRAVTGVTLVPNGADHHARQAGSRDAIAALENAGRADGVHRSSLDTFAASLVERADAHALPSVRGELRDSYGYTWTLQGTFASRAHEKRLNAGAERCLIREAEPWSALAARATPRRIGRRPLIDAAWRTLLAAHPHDTLCGCSIDEVAVAMEGRVKSAANQAAGIRDDAVADLIGHDRVAAREASERWSPVVLVRNPAARARSGVIMLDVDEWIADIPVGPGSGAPPAHSPPSSRRTPRVPSLGQLQVASRGNEYSLTESPRHYPDNDLIRRTRVAAWVTDTPAYGIAAHPIGAGAVTRRGPARGVESGPGTLRNAALSVSVADDGTVALDDSGTGRRVDSLLALIDEDDAGDLYTPAPRPRAFDAQYRGRRLEQRGPLRGELVLRYTLRGAESRRRASAEVFIHLILDADAPFVRIDVRGENLAENHRVRLAIRTGVPAGETWADAAFGAVRREPLVVPESEAAVEMPPPTAPLHRYVSRFDAVAGATVYSDGLAEYESRADGAVIVTLVRAVGDLSKNDLLERPGHAGWPRRTPAAQCLGAFAGEFAVMLHGPRTPVVIDAIERTADDVLCPMVGWTLRSALGTPAPVQGVELAGAGLAFSAIKESEDGEWLVLRCINLLDEAAAGSWRLPFDIHAARRARLDETPADALEPRGRDVSFVAGPRDIVTILIR